MKGLSVSNLKCMRLFAAKCPDRPIGQQSADQLPWFHIVTLITKLPDHAAPLDTSLPRIEEIEAELSRDLEPESAPNAQEGGDQ